MSYQGYLIGNFGTGLDKELQPWLLPDDAQSELFDGYVYRGVWQKREGYSQYATGQRGGVTYCESRMVRHVTNQLFGVGNGTTGPYNGYAWNVFLQSFETGDGTVGPYSSNLSGSNISPGSVVIIDTITPQTLVDDGSGNLTGDGTGTIDYTSGAVSFTFNLAVGLGNPITQTYTNKPVRRGSVSITHAASAQTLTDDGEGGFTGDGSGSIDYTTGSISISFNANANATPINITFDFHQGLPVMGVMNFYTQQNTRELIVADTTYVNRYNATTNRVDDISPTVLLTGTKFNFMSWVNYPTPENLQRLLFVNNKDPVQRYDGTSVSPFPIYTASTAISGASFGTGDGTPGPYTFTTPASTGVLPGSVTITAGAQVVTDNQFGTLQGDGTGTVDYLSGSFSVTFNANVALATPITINYQQLNTPIDTALHLFQFKDRLVVLFPTENGTFFGHRIRISGTGAFGDVFTSDAIGAGFIDIPDETFISSSDFNRDDLLIFTYNALWTLKYTQNDVVPFALDRLDDTRGSAAPYCSITYLNRTNAVSPTGFIITDGYSVERADDKIPDYSYNQIDQDNFALCFAGSVDTDRDHYLLHPSPGEVKSDRILVTNYEEDNYSIYRIPLSCMGNYIVSFDVTWNDLSIYPTWDALANVYGNWNSFAYSKGGPVSIGGGHEGQIFRLNDIETEDYPVRIWDITVIDDETLQVTTDFQNYQIGDYIVIEAVSGMTEVNNKQAPVVDVLSPYTFNLRIDTTKFSSYTEGGVASKTIVFDCKTKKFNPFANQDKKVSCGWIYFYVSTTGTDLTINKEILNATQSDPCTLNVPGHGYKTGDQIYIDGVQGMTELNGLFYYVTVIDSDNISLNGIDSSGFTAYSSAGFTSTPDSAILQVRCISNDTEQSTLVTPYNPAPYQVNLSSGIAENGIKKWYKLWINQTARFIQFQVINNQAGAQVQIHAMMPGFTGLGRLV
jgi:hypothetical protein